MKQIIINLIYLLMALNIFACNASQKKDKEDKLNLDWQPGINAPKYYPMTIVSGSFTNEESVCGIASGVCQYDGWGESGQEMSTGHFVPTKLSIAWFSHAEDKFFKGVFELPVDTIKALFKQGYTSRKGRFFGYKGLVVNVYPQGGVALWMQAGGRRKVEIAHFQGEEMEYDWKSMYPNMIETREEDNRLTLQEAKGSVEYIAQHGITQEPFKTIYRQRYNYTIVIDGVPHEKTVFLKTRFFNEERETIEGDEFGNDFFKTKAVPKRTHFQWVKDKVVYYGDIYFDAKEMYDLFAKMSAECPNEPYVMHLKPNYDTRKLTVTLSSGTQEIEIQRTGKIGKSSSQRDAELF